MNGPASIRRPENVPSPRRVERAREDRERRRFDPEELVREDAPASSDDEPAPHHDAMRVGHRDDDESGSRLDLTA